MGHSIRNTLLALTALGGITAHAQAAPTVKGPISDHMVLQRDEPVGLSGTAEAGERVSVTLGGVSRSVRADRSGTWSIDLPPLAAGGPYTLTIAGSSASTTFEDVLIGDVFLCSGQSNMAWPVDRALNGGAETNAPHPSDIRLLQIAQDSQPAPIDAFLGDPKWQVAVPESVGPFSAVCYFFGQRVHREQDVPVGLINSSWGGTAIEPWIGADALRALGGYDEQLDLLESYSSDPAATVLAFGADWEEWWAEQSQDGPKPWTAEAATLDWKPLTGPMRDWKLYGDPELENHLGMVWFRQTVTLTEEQAAGDVILGLAQIDEVDSVWVNGKFVANTFGWGTPRNYTLPAGTFKAGENLIVINLYNSWGQGGLIGPEADMKVTAADGSEVSIAEGWQYLKVPAELGSPPRTPWEPISGLAGISNAMIAPLEGLNLKGAIWYQGESNTGRGESYEGLMRALIGDWRSRFGEDLTVGIVQLPGFGSLVSEAGDSGWAQVREGQRKATLNDPLAGFAVIIDAGNRWDIHPPNKRTVANRLYDVMATLTYGGDFPADGFSPTGRSLDGTTLTIDFGPAGDSFRTVGSDRVTGFSVCGEDGACRYVDAALSGGDIVIEGIQPGIDTEVRYLWADVPLVNLYGENDVPVTPFRMYIDD